VGYSGGAKHLFPGVSGGDFLHFFYWLGAVITCKKIIGIEDTILFDGLKPKSLAEVIKAKDSRGGGLFS